jgi:hypothetical protein
LDGQKGEIKNPLIHMVAHESLLYHLKPNNFMQSNGLCLLSSIGQMKKPMTNVLKIYYTLLTIRLRYGLV